MLYPKIKVKKSNLKKFIYNIIINIKELIYKYLKTFQSKEYFILFMKKNFHI